MSPAAVRCAVAGAPIGNAHRDSAGSLRPTLRRDCASVGARCHDALRRQGRRLADHADGAVPGLGGRRALLLQRADRLGLRHDLHALRHVLHARLGLHAAARRPHPHRQLLRRWSPRTQARVDAVCYLVFFFPALAVFTWLGWDYFWQLVRAERAHRHQPVDADRLAVQVRDAGCRACCCCCRASPKCSAPRCARTGADGRRRPASTPTKAEGRDVSSGVVRASLLAGDPVRRHLHRLSDRVHADRRRARRRLLRARARWRCT